MSNVRRVYVEKKPDFAVKAKELKHEIKHYLGITTVEAVRVLIRYDVENISEETYKKALYTVFSEPPVDDIYEETFDYGDAKVFTVEFLPGQFDQRADSALAPDEPHRNNHHGCTAVQHHSQPYHLYFSRSHALQFCRFYPSRSDPVLPRKYQTWYRKVRNQTDTAVRSEYRDIWSGTALSCPADSVFRWNTQTEISPRVSVILSFGSISRCRIAGDTFHRLLIGTVTPRSILILGIIRIPNRDSGWYPFPRKQRSLHKTVGFGIP